MTPELAAHHNRLYEEALYLSKDYILLEGKLTSAFLGPLKQLKLMYSAWLFERAIKINPNNWQAMWFKGKIHQRLRNNKQAFASFEQAYTVNPLQPDVLREFSISAMRLGRSEKAIEIAGKAVQQNSKDSGLLANLALAFLLDNRIVDSQATINQALALNPLDKIALHLKSIIESCALDSNVRPKSIAKLVSGPI